MIWEGYRTTEFAFKKVSWPELQEIGEYGCFTGGDISWGALTPLKVSGNLEYKGYETPDAGDMVRIYATVTDQAGESLTAALATMFVEVSAPTETPRYMKGKAKCYSALQVASDFCYGYPYTVAEGTNCVQAAKELLESLGLTAGTVATSSYALAAAHTFKAEDTALTIANWLLSAAGFSSVDVDGTGRFVMRQYVEPSQRGNSWTFRAGEGSTLGVSITTKNDIMKAPNIVVAYYEGEAASVWASAENVGASSKTSTVATRRKRVQRMDVTELQYQKQGTETDGQAILRALKAKAAATLADNSQEIEHKEFSSCWVPVEPEQGVTIDNGESWSGFITGIDLELTPAMKTKYAARRFKDNDIQVSYGGSVIYEA